MVERFVRQSPLSHLGLAGKAVAERRDGDGVAMAERPHRGIVNLRGDAGDSDFNAAVAAALGAAPPVEPNTAVAAGEATILWLGPDEWWVVTPPNDGQEKTGAALEQALGGRIAAVTDVGHYYTAIEVSGPDARALLMKGCPLDLHPRAFAAGQVAQSVLAKASVCLNQTSDAPSFDLYVRRSFADYLWRWLEDAAREYGLTVLR